MLGKLISKVMDKYNEIVTEIKSNMPDKPLWLVKIRLFDGSEIGLEYKAHNMQQVKSMYSQDVKVYNGLLIGEGASKKYIRKKDISRVMGIVLVDSGGEI